MEFINKHPWASFVIGVGTLIIFSLAAAGLALYFKSPSQSVTSIPAATSSKTSALSSSEATPECSRAGGSAIIDPEISTNDPGLKTKMDTIYYQVYGRTASEIRKQLSACGPELSDGIYDASTVYRLNYKFLNDQSAQECRAKNIVVGLNTEYLMPNWNNLTSNSQLAERWQNYYDKLLIHEQGHSDISQKCAEDLLSQLQNLGSFGDCNQIESKAAEVFDLVLSDCNGKYESYDNETEHGRTQGAVFP